MDIRIRNMRTNALYHRPFLMVLYAILTINRLRKFALILNVLGANASGTEY